MKVLITYSSKTDNTKKMAKAIYEKISKEYQTDLKQIKDVENTDSYDCILVGGYNDKAVLDKDSLKFIDGNSNKNLGIFATAGAGPQTKQGKEFITYMKDLLKDKNSLGVYLLPGRVSKKLQRAIKLAPSSLVGLIRSDLKENATSKEIKENLLDFINKSRNATDEERKKSGDYFLSNIKKIYN